MRMKKKMVSLVIAVSLVMGCLLGGTLAWLTDKTEQVKNTFTVGNINIDLDETDSDDADDNTKVNSYKMIPGNTILKDPTVTVKAGSEECWLFVKIDKTGGVTINGTEYGFDQFITYGIVSGWQKLEKDKAGNTITDLIYYQTVPSLVEATEDLEYSIIKDAGGVEDQVSVKDTVTKEMMDALELAGEESFPQLNFTAYAVQKANISTVEDAWAELNP